VSTRLSGELVLRTPVDSDPVEIRRLMEATIVLGRPVPEVDLADYLDACLGWYLTAGLQDAAVCRIDGSFRGYSLVCIDPENAERALRRSMAQLAVHTAGRALLGRVDAPTRRFYRLRLRDAITLGIQGRERSRLPHAHLNVVADARSGSVALALRDHIDRRVVLAGYERWMGEVNAPFGARASALERLGFEVVKRQRNHTLSQLSGRVVERLTVERQLG
jgi:hypothetical protein